LQKQLPQIAVQANGITELIQQNNLVHSPEEYQDKLSELFKLFIQQQWSRFVQQPEFPAKEFLLHLFNFTFTDNISALTFGERLSLWISIIRSFNEKIAPRYTETIVQLVSNIIIKMQFQHNAENLDFLDTEEVDENLETELQSFRNNCIEVILIAAEVEPCKIFDLLCADLNKENGYLKNYVNIIHTLPDYTKDATPKMSLNEIIRYTPDPSYLLHCLCRDLTTLLQTITQTCSVITNFTCDRNNSIINVIKTCILTLKLANQKKLHLLCNFDANLKSDIIELQAQLFSSVRILMLMRTEIYENHNEIYELIDSTLHTVLPIKFGLVEPPLVVNAAAQLLITITEILRPNYFLKNPLVQELLHSDLSHFDAQTRLLVKQIIFNFCVLPYNQIAVNHINEQEYEKRSGILQQYVIFISYKFLASNNTDTPTQAVTKDELKMEFKDYEYLLNAYENTNNYSKSILLAAINPIIKKSIEIFQFAAKAEGACNVYDEKDLSVIIDFNLCIVKCLQVQLGSDFVINIVRLFLDVASLPNRSVNALNKLLEMLIYIVQHTGNISIQLLPDILKLSIDDLAMARTQLDISLNLFSLYHCILQNHWNFFQKNQPIGVNVRNREDDLMKIFTLYGQFLCNASPIFSDVGRVILNSLESLNEKWRIYDRPFFKNTLLKSFLNALLRLLISPNGILFYDLIISIIFNMSVNSKPHLHETLSAVFNDETKVNELCLISDLPSFASAFELLIQNAHASSTPH
jgi:hypothetical protein